jgi:hypothetical protein
LINQKQNGSNRYILDEIYENLIKLENDINQDYVIDDIANFINFEEIDGF